MRDESPKPCDPLLPPGIAWQTEKTGIKKAGQGCAGMFVLAVLGGAFVALGGLFATVTIAGATGHLSYGVMRLLMGATFSLGLILVVIGGAQLFTSDALMVMAWASGRLAVRQMLRAWTVVWAGNLVGALGTALLVFLAGHYNAGHGEVGASALYLAAAKSSLDTGQAFFLGILCNVLVCLAVWLATAAQDTPGKVLAIFFPITAFVAAGFEHCVANMFFVPYGLMIKAWAPDSFWLLPAVAEFASADIPFGHFLLNLATVTAGNWVGGAVLVGGAYWLIYGRPEEAQPAPRLAGAPKIR